MSWYGDPDDLDRLGAQLSAAAAETRDRARVVRGSSTWLRWRGPAADAFHASVSGEAGILDRAAGELDDAAAAMRGHADAVRAEIARLLAVERAAKRLVVSAVSALEGVLP
jgi:hypothetical protein